MLRYLTVALAAIYFMLLIFGDQDRRPEVTRQARDDVTGFSLASFALPGTANAVRSPTSGISEAEAVQIALQKGLDHRNGRTSRPLRGLVAAVEAAPAVTPLPASASDDAEPWYVTGERVNLRAGPGTGNAVVGQLAFGDAAEVLDDRDGWYEIRTTDGVVSGWIFGRFLNSQLPG